MYIQRCRSHVPNQSRRYYYTQVQTGLTSRVSSRSAVQTSCSSHLVCTVLLWIGATNSSDVRVFATRVSGSTATVLLGVDTVRSGVDAARRLYLEPVVVLVVAVNNWRHVTSVGAVSMNRTALQCRRGRRHK